MAFIPVPDVAFVDIRMNVNGVPVSNGLYFRFPAGGITTTNLNDLVTNVETWWGAELAPLLSSDLTLDELIATDLTSANSFQIVKPSILAGTRAGVVLPLNVSWVVKFLTAQHGRSYRGRNYWPVLLEADVTNNTVSAVYTVDIVDAYTTLLGIYDLPDWSWGVVSKFSGGAPRASGLFTPIINVSATDDQVDTRRRRLP